MPHTKQFKQLPEQVQQAIKGVLDYMLIDKREAEDFLEFENESHVWISITILENFAYGSEHEPRQFAQDFVNACMPPKQEE